MHPQFSDNSKKITTFTDDKSSYQCMWALAPSNTWKDSRYWWKDRKIKPSLSVVFWAMIRAPLHLKLYPCMLSLSLSSAVSYYLLLHSAYYGFITPPHSTDTLSVFVLIHTKTRRPPFITHCLQWFRVLDASCSSQVLLCTWSQLWIQAQQAAKEINRSWLLSRPQRELRSLIMEQHLDPEQLEQVETYPVDIIHHHHYYYF